MKYSIPELVDIIERADKEYYGVGESKLTDQEYDSFKEMLREVDPDNPLLKSVGHVPVTEWEKAEHSIAMGSLNNVFNEEEFLRWASKFQPDTKFTAQPKLDGLSVALEYHGKYQGAAGEVSKGITRGNGEIGENITPNVMRMKGISKSLTYYGSVRGEVLLPKTDLTKINEDLPDDRKYKNARNAAAGISRRYDGKYCDLLCFMPYDFTDQKPIDEDKKIDMLKEMGFNPPQQIVGEAKKMVAAFEDLKKQRGNYPFGIDGMVVKVCSAITQREMGVSNGRPRAQIAWKFDPPGAVTVLNECTLEVGRTGVVTPLGHVEPVEIDGSTIRKVTLHNIAEIKRLGIGLGDKVMLVKAGDIIPKITQVLEHKGVPIHIPTECPSCGSELENDGTRLFCHNPLCEAKNLNRILNWIKVVEIDNLGEALVRQLYENGAIRSIADIYALQKEDIASVEGWGHKSAGTICGNIVKSKTMKPEKFLAAVGIPTVSIQTSKDLIAAFGDIDGVLKASTGDIEALKGYGEISAAQTRSGLDKFCDEIRGLLSFVNVDGSEETKNSVLDGKSFCFTGKMSMPRKKLQDLAKDNGGSSHSSVTKDTDYLVCNEDKGSSKTQKAKKYGTEIITEKQFLSMLGDIEEPETPESDIENISLF